MSSTRSLNVTVFSALCRKGVSVVYAKMGGSSWSQFIMHMDSLSCTSMFLFVVVVVLFQCRVYYYSASGCADHTHTHTHTHNLSLSLSLSLSVKMVIMDEKCIQLYNINKLYIYIIYNYCITNGIQKKVKCLMKFLQFCVFVYSKYWDRKT